jgi:hypothetical protein
MLRDGRIARRFGSPARRFGPPDDTYRANAV